MAVVVASDWSTSGAAWDVQVGMGRANKRGVVEAMLFGAHQRLIDLDGRLEPELDARIIELGHKLRALGGDPEQIRADVAARHEALLNMFSEPVEPMSVSDQYDELRNRSGQ